MFTDTRAFSGFSVGDLAAAKDFYRETLGLRLSDIAQGLAMLHLAGDRDTLIYEKPDHAPATYTMLNFPVDDIEAAVGELARRGVEFDRPAGMQLDAMGIHRGGGPLIAWFRDPAGNVLSVLQQG